MDMTGTARASACLLALALAGCVAAPARYAETLSSRDPKWDSPRCVEMRLQTARYEAAEAAPLGWGTGLLLGPYGLGIAAAGREQQEKRRRAFNRELHLACSGRPLPRELERDASAG